MMEGRNINKYRRIQGKILELDDAAKNELDENMYKLIRTRLIDPMNDFFFQLHLAFEQGRTARPTPKPKSVLKRILKEKSNDTINH